VVLAAKQNDITVNNIIILSKPDNKHTIEVIDTAPGISEYAISGWFKTITDITKFATLFQVSSVKDTKTQQLGSNTLRTEFGVNNVVRFSTYTFTDLKGNGNNNIN
jgi:hypothetical protein